MRRAGPTSDVTRVRPMLLGGAVASLAALAALAVGPDARAPGPVSAPHARARLACAACHGEEGAARACTGCHGSHASTRAGHRALAARSELGCVTCHSVHRGEGVTFTGDRGFVVWGPGGATTGTAPVDAPRGVTVPFVPVTACMACHRSDDARDPVARCVSAGAMTCFDEHVVAGGASDRFVAWEAARTVVDAPRPVRRASLVSFGWAGAAIGAGAIAFAAFSAFSWRPKPATSPTRPPAPAQRVRLPVIDPSTCLGCSACVDACPFDVLTVERFVAVVARPSACCGAVLCADVCPNGSLQIADGDLAPERPRVDAHLESLDAPGVFLAGDLTGLPLIRNAIRQGASVAERVASTRATSHPELDLLVVGAGPAGLSAMLRAKELGLRAACLEQGAFAASLRSFPRGKVVFDVPGADALEGPLWMQEATKEELIARWTHAVRARGLDVREHRRVADLSRDADGFLVSAEVAGAVEQVRAGRILLAIGRRGTPRTLPLVVAPGAEGNVSYALADAKSFAGRSVLVVGLGDAAIEATIALAHQAGTTVTVSYRGARIARGRARNVAELNALVARGRVRILFQSTLEEVGMTHATFRVGDATERLACDAVLVLIGGTPSWDLVARAGVRLAREGVARPGPDVSDT